MSLESTATILGIISTTVTLLIVLGKWLVVIPLKNFIAEHTYPIQPTANGGNSLPDIAKTVVRIETNLNNIIHQVDKIEDRLDIHILQHNTGAI